MPSFWRCLVPVAALACTLLCGPGARADNCKPLARVASLDLSGLTEDRLLVPVTLDHQQVNMQIDTGTPLSFTDDVTVVKLQLLRQKVFQGGMFNSEGQTVQYMTTVDDLEIGGAHARGVRLLIDPSPLSQDGSVGGLLGADFLHQFDIEIDFANKKINLFAPDHCPGVVYWPASAIAAVPMRLTRGGYLVVSVTLDGKPFDALLDTGSNRTLLSDTAAHDVFGVTVTDADPVHTFKSLDLDGIAMSDVPIVIFHSAAKTAMQNTGETGTRLTKVDVNNGVSDLILGMEELRHLHLFISYGEGRLYATP